MNKRIWKKTMGGGRREARWAADARQYVRWRARRFVWVGNHSAPVAQRRASTRWVLYLLEVEQANGGIKRVRMPLVGGS